MEQHVENLRKIIQDEIKASQTETNNSEMSHTRDNSVEPPILSATIEVQDLQVQEEEFIVEPKQQVFEDTQLDEVDKIGTMVSSTAEEKTILFATLHPNIDFVIPDIFTDVTVPKALLLIVFLKVVPTFKQASSAQILILSHFKTRGRVFSNQRSMMQHNLLHIVWISILNFEFSFYCG